MSAPHTKLTFPNGRGQDLAARLELPSRPPHAWALFAHCFTCSKDIAAATRISRALSARGIAVLRFDFTGLGGSDGDFGNTNFSSNVEDLVAAADFLREQHGAPQLLVGHSLGGAAVLMAAGRIPEVRAVATIGAPSDPAHLKHLFAGELDTIEREGVATVRLAGRDFPIQKQFLDDLEEARFRESVRQGRRALLVLHSPQDDTVELDHARRIYAAAEQPKSFVTLDGADHLLSRREDAEYAADVIATWSTRYLPRPEADSAQPGAALAEGDVRVVEQDGFTQEVQAGRHALIADEPVKVGGHDLGPTPYDYVLAGLGACTSMTLRMYADHKQWPLEGIEVTARHSRVHATDCEDCEPGSKIDRFERDLVVTGPLSEEQRARLVEIAGRCPVHRTLEAEAEVVTRLVEPG